jgi:hypothetical protein
VARDTFKLTHLAFWFEASTDLLPALLRSVVAPLGAPLALDLLRRASARVARYVAIRSQMRKR